MTLVSTVLRMRFQLHIYCAAHYLANENVCRTMKFDFTIAHFFFERVN